MKTAIRNSRKPVRLKATQIVNTDTKKVTENSVMLPVPKIGFSPLNYRKFYDQQALEDFAALIAVRGVLSPVIVRATSENGYELVVGERRLRAAQIAGLQTIPAFVRDFTDEEVKEIQLVENLQREDPHPLHEAQAILMLQQSSKTLDEIARLLGKPKAFIYNRLKLAELIEPLQEVFFAGKLTLSEATELGSLAADTQQEFFAAHCEGWKEKKHFFIGNTRHLISRYKYDLKMAPFNTRDKNLVPDVGACTGCPFNSATVKALFPEMAKEAVCGNKACFKNKCLADAEIKIRTVLKTHQPEGVVLGYDVGEENKSLLASLPETGSLPQHGQYDVLVLKEPTPPQKDDYTYRNKEKGKDVLMRERYSAALQEYRDDLSAYRQQLAAAGTRKGLLLRNTEITAIYYNPEKRCGSTTNRQVTAREVQQAIKENTATKQLLTAEMERLKDREKRAKELDREKVQVKLHEQFCEHLHEKKLKAGLTKSDTAAIRFIAYQALNYHNRIEMEKVLFPKGYKDNADCFEKLAALSNEQVAYLVRAVISGSSDSKMPTLKPAYFLYKIAGDAGLDIAAIENDQAVKIQQRQERLKERVKDLQARIKKMKVA